ncbi:MAG: diaminopropionate ammonia-lyase, partial [Phycisphaerales bacterium]|nr:diaminopropionate ammonia-lyase [Phycisphaerales bacterium]
LHSLRSLALELGVEALYYKDESERFELSSFKALGGAYAVQVMLQELIGRAIGRAVTMEDIASMRYPKEAGRLTVVAATDGNHGRSVAWGAQRFGCACVIYMHEQVSDGRQAAVEAFGGRVCRVQGNYDDSVRAAAADAQAHGWHVVSDTSWPGYMDIPRDVMAGYTVMTAEAMEQWPLEQAPTHVFIQGGCGGLAGAVCLDMWCNYGVDVPTFVIVEPEPAACMYESALAGELRVVDITTESLMAGLSCGEVSLLAWPVVKAAVSDFLTITDDPIGPLMRRLAQEESIVAGESAVAGLAGLAGASADADLRNRLRLSPVSRVLVFGTEGATDPAVYQQLVG